MTQHRPRLISSGPFFVSAQSTPLGQMILDDHPSDLRRTQHQQRLAEHLTPQDIKFGIVW